MAITALEPVTRKETVPEAAAAPKALGKDEFLKLLVTQVQYQNPLKPMEGTEFTAQLAQFSNLEQLFNTNQHLESLLSYEESINRYQALSLVGKKIKAISDHLYLKEDKTSQGNYHLEDRAWVCINIYDDSGTLVRSIEEGPKDAGLHSFTWDGKDKYGNKALDGTYSFKILASDIDGNPIPVKSYVTGVGTGLEFKEGVPYLLIGGLKVPIEDILEVVTQ